MRGVATNLRRLSAVFAASNSPTFSLFASYHRQSTERVPQSHSPERSLGSRDNGHSKLEDALHLFDEMTHENPLPSLVHFIRLISSIVKMKHFDIAMSLLGRVELLGIPHNEYSLAVLINCCCQLNHVSLGLSVLGKLLKLGYSPNCVIFNTLINGFINVDELDQSLTLLDRFLEQGFHPDLVTYGALTRACAEEGKMLLLSPCLGIWNPAESVSQILSYTAQSLTAFVRKSY